MVKNSWRVYPTLNLKQRAMLDELIVIGNYGATYSEVAEYLIKRSLDDMLRSGILEVTIAQRRMRRQQ